MPARLRYQDARDRLDSTPTSNPQLTARARINGAVADCLLLMLDKSDPGPSLCGILD
jgi:hypothetical protein